VLSGEGFLKMIVKGRWAFVAIAVALFIARVTYFQLKVPYFLLVTESDCWIFSLLAFGYKYLNHGSKALSYLSKAAYPVYILHMIFLYLGGLLLFPLEIPVQLKFVALLLVTGAGCFLVFEFIIRRSKWVGLLFGVR
jgi:hypothetical protein